jgi:hypothetical protein
MSKSVNYGTKVIEITSDYVGNDSEHNRIFTVDNSERETRVNIPEDPLKQKLIINITECNEDKSIYRTIQTIIVSYPGDIEDTVSEHDPILSPIKELSDTESENDSDSDESDYDSEESDSPYGCEGERREMPAELFQYDSKDYFDTESDIEGDDS